MDPGILESAYEHAENGEYGRALALYDAALSQDPQNALIIIDRGATLQNMGDLAGAIAAYDSALALLPGNPDALLNKGSALHGQSMYEEAVSCYDEVLERDGRCAAAHAYKGLALGEMGDLAGAVGHFKRALAIDDKYELAAVSLDAAQGMLGPRTR